jgi:ankyrin repeat protein
LKDLLPKNQVQDINVFRPRDEENMKLRFETLKACHGQVRARRMEEKTDRHRRRLKRRTRREKRIAKFDGPQQAFRPGCSDSLSTMPSITGSSTPEVNWLSAVSVTSSTASTLYEHIDPQLLYKPLLMNFGVTPDEFSDGSSVELTQAKFATELHHQPISQVSEGNSEAMSADQLLNERSWPVSTLSQSSTEGKVSLQEEFSEGLEIMPAVRATRQIVSHERPLTPIAENAQINSKKAQKSVKGLTERVAAIELQQSKGLQSNENNTRAQHTTVVSRFSGASSSRSSLMSWVSRVSSRLSVRSSLHSEKRVGLETGPDVGPPVKPLFGEPELSIKLSALEEDVWTDMIDVPNAFAYSSLSSESRPCCGASPRKCAYCGLESGYRDSTLLTSMVDFRNLKPDYFGNTRLHWATDRRSSYLQVQDEILMIINHSNFSSKINHTNALNDLVEVTNTTGETVLHLIKCYTLKDLHNYGCLVENIAVHSSRQRIGFRFNRRDCHGQTILHRLLLQLPGEVYDARSFMDRFQRLVNLTDIPLDTADNHGQTISKLARINALDRHEILLHLKGNTLERAVYGLTSGRRVVYSALHSSNDTLLPLLFNNKSSNGWDVNWIDENGDTILIALLKYQMTYGLKDIKFLLDNGADLAIKDRQGVTALCAAVCSGQLGVTHWLLKSGANVHSRNYAGLSILLQAAESMRLAKQDKKYGREHQVLNCTNLLIDFGAIKDPTDVDEWMTPEGRTEFKAYEHAKKEENQSTTTIPAERNDVSPVYPGKPKIRPQKISPLPKTPLTDIQLEAMLLSYRAYRGKGSRSAHTMIEEPWF